MFSTPEWSASHIALCDGEKKDEMIPFGKIHTIWGNEEQHPHAAWWVVIISENSLNTISRPSACVRLYDNKRRPHQSLNYQTHEEVEKAYQKNKNSTAISEISLSCVQYCGTISVFLRRNAPTDDDPCTAFRRSLDI